MNEKILKCVLFSTLITLIFCFTGLPDAYVFAGQKSRRGFFDGVDDEAGRSVMKQAQQRIEKIRKGDFSVRFLGSSNKPLKGEVEIKMVRHSFPFGTAITQVLRLKDSNPAKKEALAVCKELFTRVTVNNFWGHSQQTKDGRPDFRIADKAVAFALNNNFDIRFHALIYIRKGLSPRWAKQVKRSAEWWPHVEKRIKTVAQVFGDRIAVVDVINEIFYHDKWRKKNISKFPNQYDSKNVAKIFKFARKYLPNTKLIILEQFYPTMYEKNKMFKQYYELNKRLIGLGAPYDGIGFQAHFYTRKPSFQAGSWQGGPDTFRFKEIEKGLDYLADLGKPIHITEFSPPSRNKAVRGAQARLSDDEVAQWTVNFYTLAFSKPYIKEIVRWFLIDELGGRGMDAGLINKAGKRKPAYYALRKLLKETWSTKWQGTLVDGKVKFRGFFGKYMAKINGKEIYFDLKPEGKREIVAVIPFL